MYFVSAGVEPFFLPLPLASFVANILEKQAQKKGSTPEEDYTSNPEQAAVYAYLAGGASGIISNWLETGTQEPPQQVAELIQALNETVLTVLVP